MSIERDLQSKLAFLIPASVTIDDAEEQFSATIIDTLGFRNVTVMVHPSVDLAAGDVCVVVAEDSPDGVTYTDVAEEKFIPTRNYADTGMPVLNAVAPYEMTFGVTSTERYLKIGINATAMATQSITFSFVVVMESEVQDFTAYDPGVPTDALP